MTAKYIQIGNNCFIRWKCYHFTRYNNRRCLCCGAGAVVTMSFPENSVISGNPANLVKKRGKKTLLELMSLEYELSIAQ